MFGKCRYLFFSFLFFPFLLLEGHFIQLYLTFVCFVFFKEPDGSRGTFEVSCTSEDLQDMLTRVKVLLVFLSNHE